MKCKFCQAELDEESTVCPVCGKDNEEAVTAAAEKCCCECEEELTDCAEENEDLIEEEDGTCYDASEPEQPAENAESKPKKKSPLLMSLIVVGAIAVVALLVVLVLKSTGIIGKEPYMVKGPDGQMVEATIPADGKEGEVTAKGTYTVSDKEVVAAADEVVATCGEEKLTNAELQSLYWMQVYNFMNNYGNQALASGLDMRVPLDMQVCALEPSMTWQQYFLGAALSSWHLYQSLGQEGAAAEYQLPEDVQSYLDGLEESLAKIAEEQKFANTDEMLRHDMGAGSTMEGYKAYMKDYYYGYSYYSEIVKTINPGAEEIRKYFDNHAETFKEQGVEDNGDVMVDVRHVLVEPKAEEGAKEGEFTEQAWADCEKQAQKLLDEWLAGDKTEGSFATMADANTADAGSKGRGGLYQGVKKGDMVPEFDAWCFDADRKAGDYGLVKSKFGYHIMYFCNSTPVWQVYAEQGLKSEMLQNKLNSIKEDHPVEFDYSKMVLGYVEQVPQA